MLIRVDNRRINVVYYRIKNLKLLGWDNGVVNREKFEDGAEICRNIDYHHFSNDFGIVYDKTRL